MVAADAAVDVDPVDRVGDDPGELRGRLAVRLEQHAGVARVARLGRGFERGDRPLPVRVGSEVAVQVDGSGDVDAHGSSLARSAPCRVVRSRSWRFPWAWSSIAYAHGTGRRPRRRSSPRDDGFDHIDVHARAVDDGLALPVGCPTAFPKPVADVVLDAGAAGRATARGSAPCGGGRAAPQALCEPWGGASVRSIDDVRALAEAVPGVRFLIDTGHVTAWGGDILELLPFAGTCSCATRRLG